MTKWIEFVRLTQDLNRKTATWEVVSKDTQTVIGFIKWYGTWRKYCFFPDEDTVFEQDCLRDIAEFIQTATKLHKEKKE